ncbi:MAG: thiamine phosphate synthase [Lachnospiraceae bacterium]|nr:thiamine phosphate synthase [Lachnospiraceae bacterium]
MEKECDIICITNRHLLKDNYKDALVRIAKAHPRAVILREKDMPEDEYEKLAGWYLEICRECGTKLFLHYFHKVAAGLNADGLHMPIDRLSEVLAESGFSAGESAPAAAGNKLKDLFGVSDIGVSCHSTDDAKMAESLGCTYIIAGHIFDTDCKKGIPGRGLSFLNDVTHSVGIPVYAIGGISQENIRSVRDTGATGACIMSSAMVSDNVGALLAGLKQCASSSSC